MKLQLNNLYTYTVNDASTLHNIILTFASLEEVENFITVITNPQVFSTITFYSENDEQLSHYTDMKLILPTLHSLDVTENEIMVSFGIRPRTELEKKYDEAMEKEESMQMALTYLSDDEALSFISLFPTYDSLIGKTIDAETRLSYNGELYKTTKEFTVSNIYKPGDVGTESLYTHINKRHAGTLEDPIPAVSNMEYIKGKYYSEGEHVYLMNRDGMNNGESITLQYVPS